MSQAIKLKSQHFSVPPLNPRVGIFWGLFKVHIKFFGGKGTKKSSKKIAHNKKAFEVSRLQTVSNCLENQYQGKFFFVSKICQHTNRETLPPLRAKGVSGTCWGILCDKSVPKYFPSYPSLKTGTRTEEKFGRQWVF